ncbi:hypothetical protein [Polyangium jinanense]|uniref:Uncharacterized protein n=1 Tax=Polyangium jinanense TaxID=2829994 RepID=A0A9X4AR19_9BACT|nr:hypothetical protein [Polyangium jinanense]MDC3981653.1 hypothetical protein [Polyangium jinanense]
MAVSPAADVEAEVDHLYGLPLGEFTAARDALARRLRSEGRREEAKAVAILPKPNQAAWAVNQVFRGRRAKFEALLDAGDRARAAQIGALTGGRTEPFRAALKDEERALGELLRAAREALSAAGLGVSEAQIGRIAETLRALAHRPDGRVLLDRGRLVREVDPPGFEVLAGLEASMPRRPAPAPKGEPPKEEASKKMGPTPLQRREAEQARLLKERLAKATAEEKERARRAEEERKAEEKRRRRLEALRDRLAASEAESARRAEEARALRASAEASERAVAEALAKSDRASREAVRAEEEAKRAREAEARAHDALAAAQEEATRAFEKARAAEQASERTREAAATIAREYHAARNQP